VSLDARYIGGLLLVGFAILSFTVMFFGSETSKSNEPGFQGYVKFAAIWAVFIVILGIAGCSLAYPT
jgi:hypothetical protein